MDKIIEFAEEIETEGRTLARENTGLRERLTVAELTHTLDHHTPKRPEGTEAGLPFCERWPELPNGEGTQ